VTERLETVEVVQAEMALRVNSGGGMQETKQDEQDRKGESEMCS